MRALGKEAKNYMAGNANNLVWLDMEMTGLDPDRDRIIELAMVVTDAELRMVAESPPGPCIRAMKFWPPWMIGTRKPTDVPASSTG